MARSQHDPPTKEIKKIGKNLENLGILHCENNENSTRNKKKWKKNWQGSSTKEIEKFNKTWHHEKITKDRNNEEKS